MLLFYPVKEMLLKKEQIFIHFSFGARTGDHQMNLRRGLFKTNART